MENEFVNLFELDGDINEIKRFINEHTTLTKFTNCHKVWDTHDFIQTHLTDDQKVRIANSTGGRIKSSSSNTLILYNTSPIDECIRYIIKYYINIVLKYSYYDVKKNIMYGWMYCKNGKVVDSDQILLEKSYPLIIKNTLEFEGDQSDIDLFFSRHLNNDEETPTSLLWDFSKSVELVENDPISSWGCLAPIKTETEGNKLILETIDSPCYMWYLSLIQKYNFKINYKYIEVIHRNFYGYYISNGSEILSKDFITLNYYGKSSLSKFNNLEDYLNWG
jgi:hypothetical protein